MSSSHVTTLALILLGLSLASVCHVTRAEKANGRDEADVLHGVTHQTRTRRNLVRRLNRRWPNSVVPYVFENSDGTMTQARRGRALAAMREMESNSQHGTVACIKFRPKTPSDYDFIEIFGDGCGSPLGNQGRINNNVAIGCDDKTGEIIQVFMTTLGFYREQQRPDRDEYVDFHFDNVELVFDLYLFDWHTNKTIDTLGTPYDFSSIMHMQSFAFSKKNRPTTNAKVGYRGRDAPSLMPRNQYMSPLDVLRVQRAYKCTEEVTHVKKPNYLVMCPSDDNKCDLKQASDDDFDWQMDTKHGSTRIVAKGNEGKTARLTTMTQFPAGSYCLHVSAYPYGNNSGGTLTLKQIFQGQSQSNDIALVSPYKDYWYTFQQPFPNVAAPFKVVLEYTVGQDATTDFAIDNLTIEKGIDCMSR